MNRTSAIVVGVLALILLAGVALPTFADNDAIAKFNKDVDKLVERCIDALEDAKSVKKMDKTAQKCEDSVFKLLDKLEKKLGYEVEFESFDICVYNEDLNYTACFDPIHVN